MIAPERIQIVGDHALLQDALWGFLSQQLEFEKVGEAGKPRETMPNPGPYPRIAPRLTNMPAHRDADGAWQNMSAMCVPVDGANGLLGIWISIARIAPSLEFPSRCDDAFDTNESRMFEYLAAIVSYITLKRRK